MPCGAREGAKGFVLAVALDLPGGDRDDDKLDLLGLVVIRQVLQMLESGHLLPHMANHAVVGVRHTQTNLVVVECTSCPAGVGDNRAACRVGEGRESIADRPVEGMLGSTRQLMDL